ncbi:MAG: hypothetical protein SGI88_16315 [Candidatus Hydrogenedentes bacterium]|nr:hypothetical protein [Candidatus Hydrogenedentota bacterium]
MKAANGNFAQRGVAMSYWKVISLVLYAISFGACVVLLAMGRASGPLVLLTIGTGLAVGARLLRILLFQRDVRQ